jgi:hypothetical protein
MQTEIEITEAEPATITITLRGPAHAVFDALVLGLPRAALAQLHQALTDKLKAEG